MLTLVLTTNFATAAIGVGTALPQGLAGQSYLTTLSGAGGTAPYAHTLSAGSLPPGLSLTTACVISGIPSSAGQFNFAVQSTDAMNLSGITQLSVRITAANGMVIITQSLPSGRLGALYEVSLAAMGGSVPYSFDLLLGGGSLPSGLSLTSSGRLIGTPTVGGISSFTIRATDSTGTSFQSPYTLRVEAASLTISTISLAGASSNLPYSQTLTAIGGAPPYTFDILAGNVPPGLSLATNGTLSGTPTTSGTYNFFVRVTDASGLTAQASYSVVVAGTGLRVIISSLPTGILNQIYSGALLAQGGTAPYQFNLLSGSLPAGLTLSSSGSITGSPTATGVFPVIIRLTDSVGQATQSDVLINVNSGTLTITNTLFPDGFVNTPYVVNLASSGGTSIVAYTLLSGTVPPGLSLSSAGGLSGTPTLAGTYAFVVRVIDNTGTTAQLPISIRIQSSALLITQLGLANGQVGQAYSSTVSAENAIAPFSFSLSGGTLPPGLGLSSNGNVSGTPTAGGLFQSIFRVTDSRGATANLTLPIFIAAPGLSISTLTVPAARQNQAYATVLQASGGAPPYSFQLAGGVLPDGVTLSPSGLLSGSTNQSPGTSLFTVRVSDSAGGASFVTYSFQTNTGSLALLSSGPLAGQLGIPYLSMNGSTGGVGATTYTLAAGALPPGLALNPNGTIAGTPLAAGTYTYTLRLTDAANATALFSQILTVASSQLSFGLGSLPDALLGSPYLYSLMGQGGLPPYSFALTSGFLPPGIALSPNGTLSGVSVSQGIYAATFRVTDAMGATATFIGTINVIPSSGLTITNTAIPSGRRGAPYTATLIGSGGSAPYTFTLAPGSSLPSGLSLSGAGFLSGTPLAESESTFVVRVQDSTGLSVQRSFALSVTNTALSLSGELPNGTLGIPYAVTLVPGSGVGPFSISLVSGTLPPGLTLLPAGIVSGTPSSTGSYAFVIRVRDAAGDQIQRAFTLQIGASGLAFSNLALPAVFVGQNYRAVLQANGGVIPYTYSLVAGSLPAGLALSTNGLITGIPTAGGQSSVTIRATDAAGSVAESTFVFAAVASSIGFSFNALPNAFVGQMMNFNLTATGGVGPYVFTSPAGLPPGLLLSSTGLLSGTPTQPGLFNVLLRATDAIGAVVESTVPITVSPASFRFSTVSLPVALVNQAYSQVLATLGGTGTITFSLQSGNLPNGLTLTPTGLLSGTPSASGAFPITVRAVDSSNITITTPLTLNVALAAISFANFTLPSGSVNQSYSQQVTAVGGAAPYTFSLVSGSLPAGLTLSSTGLLAGTPTSAGTFVFSTRVIDSLGQNITSEFLVGIGASGSPAVLAVVSAANYAGNGVAPGEIVLLYGTGLGPATLQTFTLVNNNVASTLGGTRVLFDEVPAPVIYTSTNQLAVVAPFSLTGKTSVRVIVEQNGLRSAVLLIPVRSSRPALFTADSSGNGPGAILNQDSSVNSATNPADRASIVSLYLTGLGQTTPASVDGQVVSTIANLVIPVSATINGVAAEVLYGGNAPGLVPGIAQVNVRIPTAALSGANVIRVTSGGVTSSGNVTVFVR
ncbi:MAG: putative Ig domain-containing protein [Bryobacteraceae bacterium]|nr:putative Ig domain-containing protein [Bryobacteraceae bacterium]